MPVPNSTRDVCSAANSNGKNGSWLVSADQIPSYPAASASRAPSAALARSAPIPNPPSTFMAATLASGHGRPPRLGAALPRPDPLLPRLGEARARPRGSRDQRDRDVAGVQLDHVDGRTPPD